MLDYYFRLALVSLRRHWTLTLLMVAAIARLAITRYFLIENALLCAAGAMFPALRAASTSPTEALPAA
jgi:hypothetical protein